MKTIFSICLAATVFANPLASSHIVQPPLALAAMQESDPRQNRPRTGNVEMVETSDQEMNAAIAKARETLPFFLAELANPSSGSESFVFKFPLAGVEHIWVAEVARDGDFLTGRLSNHPLEEGFRIGDPVRVPLSEVSDWAFTSDGVMQGQFTTRVLLQRLAPSQRTMICRRFGWIDCQPPD